MVPIEEPVAVDTMHVARNVNATKIPPFMPTALAIHTNPPERPHSLIRALNKTDRAELITAIYLHVYENREGDTDGIQQ